MNNKYMVLAMAATILMATNVRAENATFNSLKEQAKKTYVTAVATAINNYDSILKDEAAVESCIGKVKMDSDLPTLKICKNELVRVLQANPADSNDKKTNSLDTINELNSLESAASITLDEYMGKSEPQKKDLETKVVKNPLFGKEIPTLRTPEQKRKQLSAVGKHSSTALVKKLQGGKRKASAPW